MLKHVKILSIALIVVLNGCQGCNNESEGGNRSKGDMGPEDVTFELEVREQDKTITLDQIAEIYLKAIVKKPWINEVEVTKVEVTNGKLYYPQVNGPRVNTNTTLPFIDNKCTLLFKPTGEAGQATIKLTFFYRGTKRRIEHTVSLALEVKVSFSTTIRTTFENIFTNQHKEVNLEIKSNAKDADKEEYTVKKLEITHGELQFENGEVIREGSKLKHGKQQLVFKSPKELEESVLQKSHHVGPMFFPGKAKASIKLTLADSNGNENSASDKFEIVPIIFHVKVGYIRWHKYDRDPSPTLFSVGWNDDQLFDKGFFQVELELRDTKDSESNNGCEGLQKEFGEEAWKLVSWKSSDGSPLTIVDSNDQELTEFPLSQINWLYFKLGDIKLGDSSINLQVKGPCDTMQEVTIEVPAAQKLDMLESGIEKFLQTTQAINERMMDNLSLSPSSRNMLSEFKNAKDLSQKAGSQIALFEKAWKQVKDPRELVDIFSGSTLNDLQQLYTLMANLKANKTALDNYYGL